MYIFCGLLKDENVLINIFLHFRGNVLFLCVCYGEEIIVRRNPPNALQSN